MKLFTGSRLRQDDGQVSVAVLLLAVALIAAAVGVFIFGEANDARTRAQKGADAAALAAARDIREAFIPAFSRRHTAPPRVTQLGTIVGGKPANPTAVVSEMGIYGRFGAYQFAQKNESRLANYNATGNVVTADVQSEEREVESPVADEARKSLSAPASATAQIQTNSVQCFGPPAEYAPIADTTQQLLVSWSIRCTGNGHTATVHFSGPSTSVSDVYSSLESWRKVFDVTLDK